MIEEETDYNQQEFINNFTYEILYDNRPPFYNELSIIVSISKDYYSDEITVFNYDRYLIRDHNTTIKNIKENDRKIMLITEKNMMIKKIKTTYLIPNMTTQKDINNKENFIQVPVDKIIKMVIKKYETD